MPKKLKYGSKYVTGSCYLELARSFEKYNYNIQKTFFNLHANNYKVEQKNERDHLFI